MLGVLLWLCWIWKVTIKQNKYISYSYDDVFLIFFFRFFFPGHGADSITLQYSFLLEVPYWYYPYLYCQTVSVSVGPHLLPRVLPTTLSERFY